MSAVKAVGLMPVITKRVQALSKGYARRLMWALALLAPHPLLLMDEPFDGFDLRQTREMTKCSATSSRQAGRFFCRFINWAMPNGSATVSSCLRMAAFAAWERSTICARGRVILLRGWRRYFLRSPDAAPAHNAPWRPLLIKELWEVLSGRALWTMLLILCPLVGYSFFQAVSLYGEASAAAQQSPVLATGLSPLDGVLVPTLGAFYVAVTLLFPFVAIRVLGHEKESGALRLLIQLPYRPETLIATKLVAVTAAWLLAAVPAFSALVIWAMLGGHLYSLETLNLVLGHLLYGILIGAIALFAASISEGAATAAIVTLAFTIGSWVLDFTIAGRPGILDWLSRLSLTQTLRSFEQGLLSVGLLIGLGAAICGFAALAAVWLPPGVAPKRKLARSIAAIVALRVIVAVVATQIKTSVDVTEDRRNSFPAADQRALPQLKEPLVITVHLAPEDPRYVDLRRNVLSKLERTLPNVAIRLAGDQQSMIGQSADESYGQVEYTYGGRSAMSRSTSHREILPILYELSGVPPPAPLAGDDYPGYPLVAHGEVALFWFFGVLPFLIALAWWWSRRPPGLSTCIPRRRRFSHEHRQRTHHGSH